MKATLRGGLLCFIARLLFGLLHRDGRMSYSIKEIFYTLQGEGAQAGRAAVLDVYKRQPNLPHTYACSTIGPTRLNFRVRDGNGCDPRGKLTGKILKSRSRDLPQLNRLSRLYT